MDWGQKREVLNILARRIFLKVILGDGKSLKKRWPGYVSEVETMYIITENLANARERVQAELKATKTLTDKNLLIARMYQP